MRDIYDIAQDMRTQDNRCTSHPLFLVQTRIRTPGMSPDYYHEYFWYNEDTGEEAADDAVGDLEENGFEKIYYSMCTVTVSTHFTLRAAEEFIERNAHNFGTPLQVYVESAYNCPEIIAVREHLLKLERPK